MWPVCQKELSTPALVQKYFLVCPIWLPLFFFFFYNEPELDAGINPGMALTPFRLEY